MGDIPDFIIMPNEIEFDFYKAMMELVIQRADARRGIEPDPVPPLRLFCRSNGGDTRAAFGVINAIRMDRNVHGIMVGETMSSAATIWAACQKRFVQAPLARFGIHPVAWHGVEGIFDSRKLFAVAQEFEWTDRQQCHIYAEASNKPFEWWWERYNATSKLSWVDAETLIEIEMAELWYGSIQ